MPSEADGVHQAKQYIKQLYRSLADQGLLDANEFAALVRFAQEKSADFDLPRELRPKNAYNLVRLLATATRWLREGTPTFEVEGDLRARLLAIKKGEVSLDDVLAEAEGDGARSRACDGMSHPCPSDPMLRGRTPCCDGWARSSHVAGRRAMPVPSARTHRRLRRSYGASEAGRARRRRALGRPEDA